MCLDWASYGTGTAHWMVACTPYYIHGTVDGSLHSMLHATVHSMLHTC